MALPEDGLVAVARRFATKLSHLLTATVADAVTLQVRTVRTDVVAVGAVGNDGNSTPVVLRINGQHRMDMFLRYRCGFDVSGKRLSIEASSVALNPSRVRAPMVRFDYHKHRKWAPAHIQVHAESSAVGHLRAQTDKTPEPWRLHIPVGGPRFRPTLEDAIEFAINEFGVDAKSGWQQQLDRSRAHWRSTQTRAAIHDAITSARA